MRGNLLNTSHGELWQASDPRFYMLHYAVVFFVIAMLCALFGFGGIAAAGAVQIGKILFAVFLILAIASFLFGVLRNR